jgi:hypothetical protein
VYRVTVTTTVYPLSALPNRPVGGAIMAVLIAGPLTLLFIARRRAPGPTAVNQDSTSAKPRSRVSIV